MRFKDQKQHSKKQKMAERADLKKAKKEARRIMAWDGFNESQETI
jgi:hypothetical protein